MKTSNSTIWDFVKELLHEQDCVIVPGFGGFVCNSEHSRIDQVSHLITPPAKRIVFNQNLKTNDGLLANRMAEYLKINYSEAVRLIDENVTKTKEVLEDKKVLVVDYFGSFRLNADANFVFLPDKQNNFLHSSFGLMPLLAEPVSGRTIKSGKARIFKDRKQVRPSKNSKRRRNTVTVLATTFVLLLAVNFYIFIKQPELSISGTTMNISSWFDSLFHSQTIAEIKVEPTKPVLQSKEELVIPASKEEISLTTSIVDSLNLINQQIINDSIGNIKEFDVMAFAEHLSMAKTTPSYNVVEEIVEPTIPEPKPIEEKVENVIPVIKQTVKLKATSISTDSSFYIIGGVFCKERNAKRFLQELEEKGFTPEIIVNERVNCNRVSYAKFASRKDAEQQLRSIHASTNPDAWLFVKHN